MNKIIDGTRTVLNKIELISLFLFSYFRPVSYYGDADLPNGLFESNDRNNFYEFFVLF